MGRPRNFDHIFNLPDILLAIFCLFAFGYLFLSPSLATPAYPQDTFFILSDGWRFANGQIPYRDYHSALGPLSGALTGFGMWFVPQGAGMAHSVLIGQGIFLLILLPITIFTAYRRLRAPLAALFCFLIVSLVASRVALGDPASSHLTVTGTYNAQGYALLLVFGMTVLLRPRVENKGREIADNVLAGILLLAMFFDKLSYFGAGVAILTAAVAIPLAQRGEREIGIAWQSMVWICASFTILAALIMAAFGISPARIANDDLSLFIAQSAKMGGASRTGRIPKILFDAARQYALIFVGFPLLLSFVYGRLGALREGMIAALGILMLVLSAGVMMGNSLQPADMFLLLMLGFILAEIYSRKAPSPAPQGVLAVTVFLVLTVMQHQAVSVLSTARAATVEFGAGNSANRWLAGTGLADLVIPHDEGGIDMLSPSPSDWSRLRELRGLDSVFFGDLSMYELSQIISEGRCLLDEQAMPGDRVFTDGDYNSVFSMLRRQPPPSGGSLGYSGDFTVTIGPDEVRYAFSDSTLLMVPRGIVITPFFLNLPATKSVLKNFVPAGQSHYWSIWRRKGSAYATHPAPCRPSGI